MWYENINTKEPSPCVLVNIWNSASNGITREWRRANAKYAAKQITRYTLRKKAVKKVVGLAFTRFTLGAGGSTFFNRKFKALRRR